jgi:hypothetical protein
MQSRRLDHPLGDTVAAAMRKDIDPAIVPIGGTAVALQPRRRPTP